MNYPFLGGDQVSKGYYEQSCEGFALYSSPWQEHCQDSGADDYQYELWATERAEMAQEGFNVECEMIMDYMLSDEFVGPLEEGFK